MAHHQRRNFVNSSNIKPQDVLFGKGGPSAGHIGTIAFKAIVESRLDTYHNANYAKRNGKNILTLQVVNLVHITGGRFLIRDEEQAASPDRWYAMDSIAARVKVREFFREFIKNARKQRRPCVLLDKMGLSGVFGKNSTYSEIILYIARSPGIRDFICSRNDQIEKRKERERSSSKKKGAGEATSSSNGESAIDLSNETDRDGIAISESSSSPQQPHASLAHFSQHRPSFSLTPSHGPLLSTRTIQQLERTARAPYFDLSSPRIPPGALNASLPQENTARQIPNIIEQGRFLAERYKATRQEKRQPMQPGSKSTEGSSYSSSHSLPNMMAFNDEKYLVGSLLIPPSPLPRRRSIASTSSLIQHQSYNQPLANVPPSFDGNIATRNSSQHYEEMLLQTTANLPPFSSTPSSDCFDSHPQQQGEGRVSSKNTGFSNRSEDFLEKASLLIGGDDDDDDDDVLIADDVKEGLLIAVDNNNNFKGNSSSEDEDKAITNQQGDGGDAKKESQRESPPTDLFGDDEDALLASLFLSSV